MFAIVRIYADANGDSHFDESTISLLPSGMIGSLSEPVPAKEIIFREVEPNYDWSYHTAPQRQYIILLDGMIELKHHYTKKGSSGQEISCSWKIPPAKVIRQEI